MSVPHRLGPDTPLSDNLAYANDNFDKLVSDLGDIGYQTAFVIISTGLGGAGPAMSSFSIEILDNNPKFSNGIRNVICYPGIYEAGGVPFSHNGDANYRIPSGSSLSSGAATALFSVYQTQQALGIGLVYQAYPVNSVSIVDSGGGPTYTPTYRDPSPFTYNTTRVGAISFNLYYTGAAFSLDQGFLIAYLPIARR